MNYEEKMKRCDNCNYYSERYFYGNTARYCGIKEKFCHDIEKCEEYSEYKEELHI